MLPRSRTRVIGISSGKGGVGKSSVTVNLAVALAQQGHDVGILDADVYGFSVPKMLGVRNDPLIIDDLVIPPTVHGVRCLSMGFFVPDEQPVIWRGPMLHKALEQFLVDAYWGEPDFLLVDMPPGTGDVTLSLGQYLTKTEVFVVTTPQAAAQRVAQRSAYAARKLKLAVRGVIENMSWFTGDDGTRYELFGAGGGQALAATWASPCWLRSPWCPPCARAATWGCRCGVRSGRRGGRWLRGWPGGRAGSGPGLPPGADRPLTRRSGSAGRVALTVSRTDLRDAAGQSQAVAAQAATA